MSDTAEIVLEIKTEWTKAAKDFSYFGILFNQTYERMGISVYLETIDNGIVVFFGSINDFKSVFQPLVLPPNIQTQIGQLTTMTVPLIWHITIKKSSKNINEEELMKVLHQFALSFSSEIKIKASTHKDVPSMDILFPNYDSFMLFRKIIIEVLKNKPVIVV